MARLDYRILGSLEAIRDGERLALGGAKQRAALAILLLNANRVVTNDALVEALWPGKAPSKPLTAIQGYVSHLRRLLAPENPFEVIVTEAAGYRLRIEPEALDLVRFETLSRRGREALEGGNGREAHTALTEALALFRGAPLADFTYEDWARLEIARLEELRLACLEERIEVDLALGRHADLVGELEALIAEHPLRERLRGQLMLALYRSGRQSEALGAYQEARQALVDEFGIDPTRALQDLERDILLQAPALDLERAVPQPAMRGGVLTLLFTDIEGSTGLVRMLGDGYPAVLLEQRRILREAVESNSGRVVDSHGDECFAVFPHAGDAAAAVAAAHRSLAEYPWPGRSRVAVRAALHTGEPVAVGDGYVGLDVHRVARICAAAHGGQVLLSQETAESLEGETLDGVGLRDLGEHSLRDLPQPEHLFQLVIAGLPDEFPQPRVESAPIAAPGRSILVLAEGDEVAVSLVDVAEPLARSHVPHELIVARLLEIPARSAESSLARASTELHGLREGLAARGVAARVAAFTSGAVGEDAVRLAAEQAVDLLLLERSSSRLGADGLDPELGVMLAGAPCDVAVCVLRGNSPSGDAVLVPFGGGEHDWAALELGAWLASANDTVLRLLGVASDPEAGKRDASRLLASASLAVQQLVGVPTEPTLLPPEPKALLEASEEGLLLVTGFPSDWRERGLGSVRSELARAARPPTLFVRRGVRPGGLAPRESQTRFTWSLSDASSVA